ncbi:MAG: DNA-binding response regulator [Alphaproteobacteria bacterium]|nr:MAG: DNA-binding response regulator [Alphaproteobacteria bacterium]
MTINDFDQQLTSEFQDEARDTLNAMDVLLGNVRSRLVKAEDALGRMRRDTHNLRIGAKSVGLAACDLILYRLDDYLADLKALDDRHLDDIQAFTDRIRAVLEGEPVGEDLKSVARALPAKKTFDIGDIQVLNIEILLVGPNRTASRLIERELQACGYRVVNVQRSFEALEMAVQSRPDLVISAAMLDVLSGVDLACALNAMPSTRGIPFALLTSFEWGHPELDGLPPTAAIIRKGPKFGDDLAEALSRFGIT